MCAGGWHDATLFTLVELRIGRRLLWQSHSHCWLGRSRGKQRRRWANFAKWSVKSPTLYRICRWIASVQPDLSDDATVPSFSNKQLRLLLGEYHDPNIHVRTCRSLRRSRMRGPHHRNHRLVARVAFEAGRGHGRISLGPSTRPFRALSSSR